MPVHPHLPRRVALGVEIVEMLLVLEGVHAGPEAVVLVSHQLLFGDQATEGFVNELLAFLQIFKNVLLESEESAVYAHIALVDVFDFGNQISAIQGNEVIAEIGTDTEKTGDFVMLPEVLDLLGKGEIGKTITVVGQEHLFAFEIFLDSFEALADVGGDAGVSESDAPIVDITIDEVDIFTTGGEDEVVGNIFVVVDEIILDGVRAMPETKDEILMAIMGVILHHMPKDGAIANRGHWLGDILGGVAPTQAESAAAQHARP